MKQKTLFPEKDDSEYGSFIWQDTPFSYNPDYQSLASKLISVQPLSGPTGLIYYLRYRESVDKFGETTLEKEI